jgi:hypothetical protein
MIELISPFVGEPSCDVAALAPGHILIPRIRGPMPLFWDDVATAIGIGLEGQGGDPGVLRMEAWLARVGPRSRTCGPPRPRSDVTLASRQGDVALSERGKSPALDSPARRSVDPCDNVSCAQNDDLTIEMRPRKQYPRSAAPRPFCCGEYGRKQMLDRSPFNDLFFSIALPKAPRACHFLAEHH